jgi:hypothetical protein
MSALPMKIKDHSLQSLNKMKWHPRPQDVNVARPMPNLTVKVCRRASNKALPKSKLRAAVLAKFNSVRGMVGRVAEKWIFKRQNWAYKLESFCLARLVVNETCYLENRIIGSLLLKKWHPMAVHPPDRRLCYIELCEASCILGQEHQEHNAQGA